MSSEPEKVTLSVEEIVEKDVKKEEKTFKGFAEGRSK